MITKVRDLEAEVKKRSRRKLDSRLLCNARWASRLENGFSA